MPSDKPIQRGSWTFEFGQPLFLQEGDPHFAIRESQDPELKIEDIHLRVDWQTLRRLPRSRGIVFNFKALFTPITDFRKEPYVPKLILKVLKEGKKPIMTYKSIYHTEHKVIPALEEWVKEQEESGMIVRDWTVRTLDEDPFFPGWNSVSYP